MPLRTKHPPVVGTCRHRSVYAFPLMPGTRSVSEPYPGFAQPDKECLVRAFLTARKALGSTDST